MGFQLPPLPSFQTNIPQMPDPLQTYGKLLQLKTLQGEQQLQPLRMQQAQQSNQLSALQIQKEQLSLDSQKKLQDAIANGAFNKFTGADTPDGSGFDAAGAYSELVTKHGVLPEQAGPAVESLLKIGQNMAEQRKTNAQAAEAAATVRGKTMNELAAKLGSIGDMPAAKAGEALDAFHQDLVKNPKAYPGLTQEELAHLYASDLGHLPAITEYMGLEGKLADFHKSKSEAISAEQKVIPEGGKMSPEMQAQANKEVQVAQRTQPLKIQTAEIEARTKQLMEGMAEPGYAFNPKTGQTQLVNKTEYLQSGGQLQAFRKVGEKDVRDDTMMTNRLGDVHQKLAEYEQALGKPISDKDRGNLAALLGTEGLKLGAFGTEIPMDRVNAALNRENMQGLSANARDQLVAYRNMREALVGYKTVLSGSARGSDKTMELLDQTIPIPSITDPDYSKRSLDSFKGNLHVVGQGLPTLPGIKNPTQIEQEVWGGQGGGKTISLSALQKAASDHGVSIEEAKRQAAAQGLTIK